MTTDTRELRGLALLDAAIAHIEAHPENWFQADYRCGSGMCVAGWVCQLGGGKWITSDPEGVGAYYLVPEEEDDHVSNVMLLGGSRVPGVYVANRAERLIGAPPEFTDDDVRDEPGLFNGGNELEDIKRIRDEIAAWFESQAIS